MNGDWYPWSRDPAIYAQAWRHLHDIFAQEGATNARWVFSLNPTPYEGETSWGDNAKAYYPGDAYVDYIGTTMINFGGVKEKSVADFAQRLTLMHELFHKDVIITEANSALSGRVKWFTDLRTFVMTRAPWIHGVVLSQNLSRGQVQLGAQVGDLSWNVTTDPPTQPVIRGLANDLTTLPPPTALITDDPTATPSTSPAVVSPSAVSPSVIGPSAVSPSAVSPGSVGPTG
jgi:hypothetical protein